MPSYSWLCLIMAVCDSLCVILVGCISLHLMLEFSGNTFFLFERILHFSVIVCFNSLIRFNSFFVGLMSLTFDLWIVLKVVFVIF